MKQSRSFKAKLVAGGFTAAVALLCGLPNAQAQSAGPNGPGGGSTPGSFLVPGTNTSISFHGIVWVQATNIFGTHAGDNGALGATSVFLNGPGASTTNPSGSLNGGFQIDAKPTRMMFSTSTPTGFGELKTYVEYDFDLIQGPTANTSNADEARLRQAYGTLGPWLIGQTWSNFADLGSWGDGDNGDPAIDAGVPATTVNGRVPQVRYTFLAGGGLSLAGSIEMPITYWTTPGSYNTVTGQVETVAHQYSNDLNFGSVVPNGAGTGSISNGGGIQTIPAFVGAVNWAQPWGALSLHGVLQQLEIRNDPAMSVNNNISKFGYGVYLAGHLNTWGKDRLGGGIDFFHGAVNYSPFFSNTSQGLILSGNSQASCGVTTSSTSGPLNGCSVSVADNYGVYANYEHFFTDAVALDVDGGYEYGMKPDNVGNWAPTALVSLEKRAWTGHVNLIWRPVPGLLSMTLMYGHWYREMWSGAKGNADAIKAQAKFFW